MARTLFWQNYHLDDSKIFSTWKSIHHLQCTKLCTTHWCKIGISETFWIFTFMWRSLMCRSPGFDSFIFFHLYNIPMVKQLKSKIYCLKQYCEIWPEMKNVYFSLFFQRKIMKWLSLSPYFKPSVCSYWLLCIKLMYSEYSFSYTTLQYGVYQDPGRGKVVAGSVRTTTPFVGLVRA